MLEHNKNNIPTKSNKSNIQKWAKFSGLAFQLLVYIIVGYFIGAFIDKKLHNEKPIGVAICATAFLIAALYKIIKDVLNTDPS